MLILPQRPDLVQFPGFSSRGMGRSKEDLDGWCQQIQKKLWGEANAGEICRRSMAVLDRSVE